MMAKKTETTALLSDIADCCQTLGDICKQDGRRSEAVKYYDALLLYRERLAALEKSGSAFDLLAKAYLFRAGAETEFSAAESFVKQSEKIWLALTEQFPQNQEYGGMLAQVRDILK